MTSVRGKLLASVAAMAAIGFAGSASADQLLSGSVASASGQKLDGVQISAKKEGSTITTSVYTDENGDYFFPALPDGKYNVWAQALGFETAKGQVDLTRQAPAGLQARRDHRSGAEDPAAAVGDARGRAAGGHRGRCEHEAHLPQPVHRLPHARAIRCSSSSTRPAGTRSST